ncbi:hypothetical protein NFI96_006411 [Prochilodus magdalenae]|nr:hypothetical protein NFI96_006411 [Prochilodus magdalenae]
MSRMEENLTDHCLEFSCPERSVSALYVFLYVCAAAVALLTVCGNLLIIISVCHFKQLHTPTNMLILSLAVSDFLVGLLVIPIVLTWMIESCWIFNRGFCISFMLASYFLTSTSIYNVALIAVDRYFALSNPFLYTNTVSVSRMCAVVLCDWCMLFLYNVALQYVHGNFTGVAMCPGYCFFVLDEVWSLVDLLVTFVLPCAVIIILYTLVFIIARRHAAAIRDLNAQTRTQTSKKLPDSMKSERKAAKVLGILVSVFLACLFPYFVYTLLGNVTEIEVDSFQKLLILVYLNSTINPVIYALCYPWFRKCAKLVLTLQVEQQAEHGDCSLLNITVLVLCCAGFMNRMEENLTDHCLEFSCPERSVSAVYVFLYVCATAVALMTVCGNLLIIISVCHFKQLHTPTNMLVLSLAVSDFLVGLLVMPAALIWMIESCWIFNRGFCIGFMLACYFLTSTSIYNVALIAVDRYFALSNPFLYTNTVSVSAMCAVVLCDWCILLLYNVALQYFNGNLSNWLMCPGDCFLLLNELWSLVDLLVTFILPCAVIIILYTLVFIIARRHAAAIRDLNAQTRTQTSKKLPDSMKSERKAAKVLGILVSVFLACLFPYFVYTLLGNVTEIEVDSFQKLLILVYLNSTINPVIYALCYPWFRKCAKLVLTLQCLCTFSSLSLRTPSHNKPRSRDEDSVNGKPGRRGRARPLVTPAVSMDLTEVNRSDPCLQFSCPERSVSAVYVLLYVCGTGIVLLTVCGNLLIIISVCHFKQLHTPTNMLILSLAGSDFLVGVSVMPFVVTQLAESCWVFGPDVCVFSVLGSFFGTSTSIYTVGLIAVDRYFAISSPFLYVQTVSVGTAGTVVLSSWVILVSYSLLFFYWNRTSAGLVPCPEACVFVSTAVWSLVDLIFVFMIPCSVIVIFYVLVFFIARRHAGVIRGLSVHSRETGDSKSERKAARVLSILVTVFLACLLPYFLYTLISQVVETEPVFNLIILVFLNSTVNPILYALCYPWFRRGSTQDLTWWRISDPKKAFCFFIPSTTTSLALSSRSPASRS